MYDRLGVDSERVTDEGGRFGGHRAARNLQHLRWIEATDEDGMAMFAYVHLYSPEVCYFVNGYRYVSGSAFFTSVIMGIPTYIIDLQNGTVNRFMPYLTANVLRAQLVMSEAFYMRQGAKSTPIPPVISARCEKGLVVYDTQTSAVIDVLGADCEYPGAVEISDRGLLGDVKGILGNYPYARIESLMMLAVFIALNSAR